MASAWSAGTHSGTGSKGARVGIAHPELPPGTRSTRYIGIWNRQARNGCRAREAQRAFVAIGSVLRYLKRGPHRLVRHKECLERRLERLIRAVTRRWPLQTLSFQQPQRDLLRGRFNQMGKAPGPRSSRIQTDDGKRVARANRERVPGSPRSRPEAMRKRRPSPGRDGS